MDATGENRRRLFRSRRPLGPLAVAPDGRHLAYYKQGVGIVSSELDGSKARTLTAELKVESLSWSSDERTLYFMGHSDGAPPACAGGLCALTTSTGRIRTVRRDRNAQYDHMTLAPDGKRAAFFDYTGPAGIALVGTDGRNFHKVLKELSTNPVWSPDGAKLAYLSARGDAVAVYDFRSRTSRLLARPPAEESVRLLDWQPLPR